MSIFLENFGTILWKFKLDIFLISSILWIMRSRFLPIFLNFNTQKKTAPSLKLLDQDGETHEFSFTKQKTVVLFWASYCSHCASELKTLGLLIEKNAIEADRILAIGLDKNSNDVFKFAVKEKYPFPVYWREWISENSIWEVLGTPTLLFIDENSVIQWKTTGSTLSLNQKVKLFLNLGK